MTPGYLQGTHKNIFALKSLVKHKSKNPADVQNIQKSYYLTAEWASAKLFGWSNIDTYPHLSKHQYWHLLSSPPEVQWSSDLPPKKKITFKAYGLHPHCTMQCHVETCKQQPQSWKQPALLVQRSDQTNKPCLPALLISSGRPLC